MREPKPFVEAFFLIGFVGWDTHRQTKYCHFRFNTFI